jgi:hypothetical protein
MWHKVQNVKSKHRILVQKFNGRYYLHKGLKIWNRCNWLTIGLCYGPSELSNEPYVSLLERVVLFC